MYGPRLFRRRFRKRRGLFIRVVQWVTAFDDYILPKVDALADPVISTLQMAVTPSECSTPWMSTSELADTARQCTYYLRRTKMTVVSLE